MNLLKASKIIKKYYEDYYDNLVSIKVKPKTEFNDLYMIVKKQSNINGKKITENMVIHEWQIFAIIKQYYEKRNYEVYNINYEYYFHNIHITYRKKEREKRYIKYQSNYKTV